MKQNIAIRMQNCDGLRLILLIFIIAAYSARLGISQDAVSAADPSQATPASLSQGLYEQGVMLDSDLGFRLEPPLLVQNRGDEERLAALEKLSANQGWSRFSSDRANAPVSVKLQVLRSEDGKIKYGYKVRSAYILYATLDKIRNQELLSSNFGSGKKDEKMTERLRDEEVAMLGLETQGDSDGFAKIHLKLLNQVDLTGVVHMERKDLDDGVILFWTLEPSLAEPGEDVPSSFHNRWAPLRQNAAGDLIAGKPSSYLGLGGYISIMETGLKENQLLFESHLILHEPKRWFPGRPNYLRSKIPASLQESAKKFRRGLK